MPSVIDGARRTIGNDPELRKRYETAQSELEQAGREHPGKRRTIGQRNEMSRSARSRWNQGRGLAPGQQGWKPETIDERRQERDLRVARNRRLRGLPPIGVNPKRDGQAPSFTQLNVEPDRIDPELLEHGQRYRMPGKDGGVRLWDAEYGEMREIPKTRVELEAEERELRMDIQRRRIRLDEKDFRREGRWHKKREALEAERKRMGDEDKAQRKIWEEEDRAWKKKAREEGDEQTKVDRERKRVDWEQKQADRGKKLDEEMEEAEKEAAESGEMGWEPWRQSEVGQGKTQEAYDAAYD